MAALRLAVIIKNPANGADFLLAKQDRPPKFGEEEYDSYIDSDLWDLPSTKLTALECEIRSEITIDIAESFLEEIDLRKLDLESALNRVLVKLGLGFSDVGEWKVFKLVEEPEFGPDSRVRTIFIEGKLLDAAHAEHYKWMSMKACLERLIDVKSGSHRIGPLLLLGVGDASLCSMKQKISSSLSSQEYPPGVMLVPMHSRTAKPFNTTNLIIFTPKNGSVDHKGAKFVAHGDALIVDPGCHHQLHGELKKIVASLPRKLIVLVTHHHPDHIDGLAAVQECNPDSILLAHVKTMHRIGKDVWSHDYTPVSGGEDIYVNGQILRVIYSPGHTDGHIAVLHVSTNSLIVGDHCVGQGSVVLDISSGGTMTDYFQSTYQFLDLSPHVLIPLHGRINLWPKHMLCGYLRNRRSREASILKAIEDGARTLFDIVANVYSGVDRSFWFPAASNVRLHMDHLAQQNRLPEEFSIQKFQATCGLHFAIRWALAYVGSRIPFKINKPGFTKLLIAGAVAGCYVLCIADRKNNVKYIS